MLKSLKLLVPALIPSWRFFDTIAASPRIEFVALTAADETGHAPSEGWREFRPRPQRLPPRTFLRRLVWNPRWNETLFLTSCAERLLETPTEHSVKEIATRIAAGLNPEETPSFRFRLLLVYREGETLKREVAYISPRQAVARS